MYKFLNFYFKDIVSSFVQAEYDGNSQQDWHQFLIWFLIKFAADTNKVSTFNNFKNFNNF